MLEFLRDACICRHGQLEVRSDLERDLENESKVDAELDMCKEILCNEIGNANQKGANYGKISSTKSTWL